MSEGKQSQAWVDFRMVKAAVTMQMALDHYQVNWLRKSGQELRGKCPIHQNELLIRANRLYSKKANTRSQNTLKRPNSSQKCPCGRMA
jgi:hypothetical protein